MDQPDSFYRNIHRLYSVVTDPSGVEYFVEKINPKNLVVMRASDGKMLQGPHRHFTFLRSFGSDEHQARRAFKEAAEPRQTAADQSEKPKLCLGMRVRVPANMRLGNFPVDVDYVVIGVNAKTINVVPLGGFGSGQQYARLSPGMLTIVEEAK